MLGKRKVNLLRMVFTKKSGDGTQRGRGAGLGGGGKQDSEAPARPVSVSVCLRVDGEGAGSHRRAWASAGRHSSAGVEPSRVPGSDSHLV